MRYLVKDFKPGPYVFVCLQTKPNPLNDNRVDELRQSRAVFCSVYVRDLPALRYLAHTRPLRAAYFVPILRTPSHLTSKKNTRTLGHIEAKGTSAQSKADYIKIVSPEKKGKKNAGSANRAGVETKRGSPQLADSALPSRAKIRGNLSYHLLLVDQRIPASPSPSISDQQSTQLASTASAVTSATPLPIPMVHFSVLLRPTRLFAQPYESKPSQGQQLSAFSTTSHEPLTPTSIRTFHNTFFIGLPLPFFPFFPPVQTELLLNSSTTVIIPPPTSSRRPANIPLRTLSTASRSNAQSASLLGEQSDEKQGRRSSLSRSSSDSDFSWSDTGDLAEQLADAEDPLQIRLRASLDEQVFGGASRRTTRHRKVHYPDDLDNNEEKERQPGLVKEDIHIPSPAPRNISRAEHFLSAIMSGGERQMNGLTGKPLVIFVSLGVFLFGYDQGVMSGIITWLLDNDHDEEGIVVIANLYGGGDIHNAKAREEYREIKMDVLLQRQEGEKSYTDMFRRYRTRVFIAMSAQAFAQLNGINVISYYAPYVFESAGWIGRQAILMTGINGITYLMSSVPPWYLVDRWGRRFILLSGAIAMVLSLSAISYFLFLDIPSTPTLVVIFVMIYNAAFGYSWGPIPWLYPPEILPLSIRSKGASLSTATNWAFNWLVGELTPVLQEAITWRLYLVHAFFCATSFVVVYFIYPETAGIRLEDMDALFGDATTAMATPIARAETGSLLGPNSPVPSMDLRRGIQGGPNGLGASNAIPGLDIDPPHVSIKNGKPQYAADEESSEGVGGWISRMVSRNKGDDASIKSSQYKPLDQDEEE
ncbi:hypothetical protein G7Y89_g5834 [Cudoniella acicularis]|uniref:Major facilitator superfamily (MFS) profile domain-containing protein n=1 Tax=Cudoniella acicularis TaxID=354080 RepID=A0A8H4RMI2_9HELO|nr:hypothetical protein G7Y89_g5834 [Cudoniella acicularis]